MLHHVEYSTPLVMDFAEECKYFVFRIKQPRETELLVPEVDDNLLLSDMDSCQPFHKSQRFR